MGVITRGYEIQPLFMMMENMIDYDVETVGLLWEHQ